MHCKFQIDEKLPRACIFGRAYQSIETCICLHTFTCFPAERLPVIRTWPWVYSKPRHKLCLWYFWVLTAQEWSRWNEEKYFKVQSEQAYTYFQVLGFSHVLRTFSYILLQITFVERYRHLTSVRLNFVTSHGLGHIDNLSFLGKPCQAEQNWRTLAACCLQSHGWAKAVRFRSLP
jgi:hypothetical protein